MRCLGMVLSVAVLLAGCEPIVVTPPREAPAAQPQPLEKMADQATQPAKAAAEPASVSAPPAAPAAAAPAAEPVMAVVNGKPIPMKALYDLLVRDYGMSTAYQLMADELVRQEAAERKLTVTAAEVKGEAYSALKRALGELPPEGQREHLLKELQVRLNVSPDMWDMLMARQALLRKLVEPDVKVTDDDINLEFGTQYGRKWTVRAIQAATIADAEKALKACKAVMGGCTEEAFAEQARKSSTGVTAGSGGLLPTITPKTVDTEVPRAIREAAMNLKKPGDMSGIVQSGMTFHILFLVKTEEPQDVKLETVRAKLAESIRERQIAILQQEHLGKIVKDARKSGKIQFVDPILKAQDAVPPPSPEKQP